MEQNEIDLKHTTRGVKAAIYTDLYLLWGVIPNYLTVWCVMCVTYDSEEQKRTCVECVYVFILSSRLLLLLRDFQQLAGVYLKDN